MERLSFVTQFKFEFLLQFIDISSNASQFYLFREQQHNNSINLRIFPPKNKNSYCFGNKNKVPGIKILIFQSSLVIKEKHSTQKYSEVSTLTITKSYGNSKYDAGFLIG